MPTPTSEATRTQWPRTSSLLRRSVSTALLPSSSTTGASSDQRTASQIATGLRIAVAVSATQMPTAMPRAPSSGRTCASARR